jgi:hypothetical protein
MKKLMTMLLGLSLALGVVAMSAQETKAPTKAKIAKTKATKAKATKAAKAAKVKATKK